MSFSSSGIGEASAKSSIQVSYDVGFACPDAEDIVQETISRFLVASQNEKIRNIEAASAFLNGICPERHLRIPATLAAR
jgi:hypothetical protein